ncbi:MAG TPA: DoxX family protein [Cyclobacteriaceae bacterium]|nr:DoxX family protein [Cyclobacteriaceae bacterium]
MIKKLWSTTPINPDFALLLLRFVSGVLIITHGWPKLMNFADRASTFADPLGIGSAPSLSLTIVAELVGGTLLCLGLFTRIALLFLVGVMAVIVLFIHSDSPFTEKEYPILLWATFFALYFTGPGRYSVDAALKR